VAIGKDNADFIVNIYLPELGKAVEPLKISLESKI
jgi:hypothetical protein